LAGTAPQNLRHRCHGLSRLSERKNVHSRTAASRQVQQPAGVTQMRFTHNVKIISSVSCEKNTPFRLGVLLSKIKSILRILSRSAQSITYPAHITDQVQLKTDIRHRVLSVRQRKHPIETP